MRALRLSSVLFAASALYALAPAAHAQDVQKGTSEKPTTTSTGSTDVTTEGFEGAAKKEETKDATELALSAGGLASSGNSRLLAGTAAGKFRVRRGLDQFSAAIAGNYSRTAPPGGDMTTTVENEQGKIRYDRFLVGGLSAFLGVQARRDRFQGIDLRLQVDPGLAYYFVDEEKQQLWAEGGYDLLHDIRRDDAIVDATGAPILDAGGSPLAKTKTLHSARTFLGYSNQINEAVSFALAVEYLQALTDTTFWKLNADATLTSKIGGKFSLATAVSLRYDHAPIPGKEKLDTYESLSLVYTLL